jgi:SAM-dependent methyltransferase
MNTETEPTRASASSNHATQAEYWNGDEAVHWVAFEDRYDRMLEPYNMRLLDGAEVAADSRVLDIGCGCGATTRAAARRASTGQALGIDLSRQMIERARARAREEGLINARFVLGDAQQYPFGRRSFDGAISRFGVMFFTDPAAALRHIADALAPRGRIAFLCWQEALENEWVTVPGGAAAAHVPLPQIIASASAGPFAFADPERVRGLLGTAGLHDVSLASIRQPLVVGADPTDAVSFFEQTGMGRSLLAYADPATGSGGHRSVDCGCFQHHDELGRG